MKESDLYYLAGLFDGEGSVVAFFTVGRPQVRVNLTMTAKHLIYYLQDCFGGNVRICTNKTCKREAWSWDLANQEDLINFLTTMHPLLRLKGPQSKLALALIALKPGKGSVWSVEGLQKAQELVDAIQRLNQGGTDEVL